MMTEADQRAAVIAEARRWIGTPWHHRARIFGAGVDCVQLLIAVYHACGLCPNVDAGDYPADWMIHRTDERLLAGLQEYAHETDTPGPGDVVAFKFGLSYSHVAIVTEAWPGIVHAYRPDRQVNPGDANAGRLAGRDRKFFTPWGTP